MASARILQHVLGRSPDGAASPPKTRKQSMLKTSMAFSRSLRVEDDRPTILIYSNDIAERQEWTGALGRWYRGEGGWTLHTDSNGEKYYYHAESNTTQWDRGPKFDQPDGFGKPVGFGEGAQVLSFRIRGSANVQDVRMQMDKHDEECLKVALLLVNINSSTKPPEFAKLMDIVSSVTTYLPVIVVLPEDFDQAEAVECVKAGASGYLKRPFPLKVLCDRVALLHGRFENVGKYYTKMCATRAQMKLQRVGGVDKKSESKEEENEENEESLDNVDNESTIDNAVNMLDFGIDDPTKTLRIEKIRRKQMYSIAERTSQEHCTSSGIDLNALGSLLHLVKEQAKPRKERKPSGGPHHHPWHHLGLKQKSDHVSTALTKLEHSDNGRRLRRLRKQVLTRVGSAEPAADASGNGFAASSSSVRRSNSLKAMRFDSGTDGNGSTSSGIEKSLLVLKVSRPGVDLARTKLREPAPTKTHASRCDTYLKVGLDLKARGDLQGALAHYSKALLVAPRNPLVHVLRGVARFEEQEYVTAIQDFSEALRFQSKHSKDTDALLNRAITYSVVGNDSAALRDLNLAQERAPEDQEVTTNRALILRRLGDFVGAKDAYLAAAELKEREKQQETKRFNKDKKHKGARGDGGRIRGRRRKGPAQDQQEGSVMKLNLGNYVANLGIDHTREGEWIHAHLFDQTSQLQAALSTQPSSRTEEDRQLIRDSICTLSFFRKFPEAKLDALCGCMLYHSVMAGKWAMRQGDYADCMAIVLTGKLAVNMYVKDDAGNGRFVTLNSIGRGQSFGEFALCEQMLTEGGGHNGGTSKRTTGLIAEDHAELLLIKNQDFQQHCRAWFEEQVAEKEQLLQRVGGFASWGRDMLRKVAMQAGFVTFPRGTLIEKQAEQPQAVYILTHGLCSAWKYADRLAEVKRAELELERDIRQSRLQYSYHHLLRNPEWPGKLINEDEVAGSHDKNTEQEGQIDSRIGRDKHERQRRDPRKHASALARITGVEQQQSRRAQELVHVKQELAALLRTEAAATRKASELTHGHGDLAASSSEMDHMLRDTTMHASMRSARMDLGAQPDADTDGVSAEIGDAGALGILVGSYFPPSVFGEQTIANPSGNSLGSVRAETTVEVLMIKKTQVQQWPAVTQAMVDAFTAKSVSYPADSSVKQQHNSLLQQKATRQQLMQKIDKNKWCVDRAQIVSLGAGKSAIEEAKHSYGRRVVRLR